MRNNLSATFSHQREFEKTILFNIPIFDKTDRDGIQVDVPHCFSDNLDFGQKPLVSAFEYISTLHVLTLEKVLLISSEHQHSRLYLRECYVNGIKDYSFSEES